ncbi:MAG: hypothetical protein Fur0035_20360 [Anaerolineales bacterium]
MPPFVNTPCPHCQHANRYDLAELLREDGIVEKSLYRQVSPPAGEQEFAVTCAACGKRFKFSAKARPNVRKI